MCLPITNHLLVRVSIIDHAIAYYIPCAHVRSGPSWTTCLPTMDQCLPIPCVMCLPTVDHAFATVDHVFGYHKSCAGPHWLHLCRSIINHVFDYHRACVNPSSRVSLSLWHGLCVRRNIPLFNFESLLSVWAFIVGRIAIFHHALHFSEELQKHLIHCEAKFVFTVRPLASKVVDAMKSCSIILVRLGFCMVLILPYIHHRFILKHNFSSIIISSIFQKIINENSVKVKQSRPGRWHQQWRDYGAVASGAHWALFLPGPGPGKKGQKGPLSSHIGRDGAFWGPFLRAAGGPKFEVTLLGIRVFLGEA